MKIRVKKCAYVLLALVAGCSASSESQTASIGVAKSPRDSARIERPAVAPKIVDIVGRDNVVTVAAGPDGPLYSARTRSGQQLFADATLEQVQVLHPEVFRQIDGVAAVSADHVIDASIDVGPVGD